MYLFHISKVQKERSNEVKSLTHIKIQKFSSLDINFFKWYAVGTQDVQNLSINFVISDINTLQIATCK
jgi:hypothetical protein